MTTAVDTTSQRLFKFGVVSLALFIPFSIAGANWAIGFAMLGWILAIVGSRMGRTTLVARPSAARDPLLPASILLVLSAVPSMLMSENISRAGNDWASYWLLLIYFVIAYNLASVKLRTVAFWVLFVSTSISCLVAFVQRAGGIDVGFIHIGGQHRASSTLFTMTFAGILYQVIVLNLSMALRTAWAWRTRLVLSAGIVIQLIALLITMTRGAWVGLIAGLITVCILVRNRLVLLAAAVMVVVMVLFSVKFSVDQGRTMSLSALLNSSADRNVSTRLVLWDIAWDMFKAHPILGVGMGDYSVEAEKMLKGREALTVSDSHNVFLQVLATRGLVGFLPFVLFWVVLLRTLFRSKRSFDQGSSEYHYLIGAIGVTVAVLAGALTENNIDDEEIFIAFMFLIGLARSAAVHRSAAAPSQQPSQK